MATPTLAQFKAKAGGKWTPAQLQAAYARLYGQTSAPAPNPYAPTPVPDLPDPSTYVNAGYDAQLGDFAARLAAQPGIYNPQRLSLATNTQQGLYDSGYMENTGGPQVDQTTDNGDITYKLTMGPDGRLYRQGYQNVQTNQNARGKLFSSQTSDRMAETQRSLNAARDAVVRGFGDAQTGITAGEQSQATDLNSARQQVLGQYGDWRSGQAQQALSNRDAIIAANGMLPGQPTPDPVAAAHPAATHPAVAPAAFRKIPGFKGFSTNTPSWFRNGRFRVPR